MVKLTGFSKASPAERIEKLAQAGLLSEEGLQTVRDNDTLPLSLANEMVENCLLYTSPSPRDVEESRMPSSA